MMQTDKRQRLATDGPGGKDYDEYQYVEAGKESIIYDVTEDEAWIQTDKTSSLEGWR